MKAGCLLLVISVGLIWGGGQGVYTGLTNRQIHEYTVAEYIRKKPEESWIRLKDGIVNMADMNYKKSIGRISKLYVPVIAPGGEDDGKVHILLCSKNAKLLAIAEKIKDLNSEQETLRFAKDHMDELFVKGDVEGLIQFGIEMNDKEVRKLKEMNPDLAPDFVIIEDGAKPKIIVPAVMLLAGLGLGAFMLLGFGKSSGGASPPPLPKTA